MGWVGPKNACTKKMAKPDFSNGKLHLFPPWSLWAGGRGGLLLRCMAILSLPLGRGRDGCGWAEGTRVGCFTAHQEFF